MAIFADQYGDGLFIVAYLDVKDRHLGQVILVVVQVHPLLEREFNFENDFIARLVVDAQFIAFTDNVPIWLVQHQRVRILEALWRYLCEESVPILALYYRESDWAVLVCDTELALPEQHDLTAAQKVVEYQLKFRYEILVKLILINERIGCELETPLRGHSEQETTFIQSMVQLPRVTFWLEEQNSLWAADNHYFWVVDEHLSEVLISHLLYLVLANVGWVDNDDLAEAIEAVNQVAICVIVVVMRKILLGAFDLHYYWVLRDHLRRVIKHELMVSHALAV